MYKAIIRNSENKVEVKCTKYQRVAWQIYMENVKLGNRVKIYLNDELFIGRE